MKTKTDSLRVISLFSGCGGMSLGFKNAGFNIVASFDNWKAALDVYRKNFPTTKAYEIDLKLWEGHFQLFSDLRPDMIIGGPPCQDFSHAGKRNEFLGRGCLTISFASLVTALRTRWFVMENVDRIRRTKTLQVALNLFRNAGYSLTGKTLDASLCGVPQKRLRFILIGELGGKEGALEPFLEHNLSTKPLTVKEYFGDDIDFEYYYRHPRNYSRRAIYSVHEPSPTIRGVNRPVPPNYPGHPGDATPIFKGLRPLTTIERSYIQTFPKSFKFEGSKTELEQMIGNAVPVKLAEYVAKCIQQYRKNPQGLPDHPKSLF